MQVESIQYTKKNGWTGAFPAMDSDRTAVLVFGASHYIDDAGAIAELAAAYPNSLIAGCSSSGEIFKDEVCDESLSVAVARFEKSQIRMASVAIADAAESYSAGQRLAKELQGEGLNNVLVLSDGLNVNGTDLVRGLNEVFGKDVVVTGGLAGDGSRFERTWVIADDKPQAKVISAIAFYGDNLQVGHGSKGGWDIFGPERRVTKSDGNVLYELDGKPALALYKEYLGDRADGLPATGLLFPLAIRERDDERQLVRTILAVDEEKNSLTFAGDVPQGWHAQLMKANFDRLVGGASDAAVLTAEGAGDGATLAIAISCVGRRLVLGERTEEEVEATLEALPAGTVQVGFYSYGELSPVAVGMCDLHNQTMTLTAIRET